ncbi:integrase core domain-containing protein [Streptomyces sp. NPDC002758]
MSRAPILAYQLSDRGGRRVTEGRPRRLRNRDGKFPELFDPVLSDAGIQVALSEICMPRIDSLMKRRAQSCRRELLNRPLIWYQCHLLHALRQFEEFYNDHRPHQGIANACPLCTLPKANRQP